MNGIWRYITALLLCLAVEAAYPQDLSVLDIYDGTYPEIHIRARVLASVEDSLKILENGVNVPCRVEQSDSRTGDREGKMHVFLVEDSYYLYHNGVFPQVKKALLNIADCLDNTDNANILYFIPIKGMKPEVWVDGKLVQGAKRQESRAQGLEVVVLSEDEAIRSFKIDDKLYFAKKAGNIIYKDGDKIVEEEWKMTKRLGNKSIKKVKDAAAPRIVPMGSQKVAAMPTNEDFENAAVWNLDLSGMFNAQYLKIDYAGDCARVYADGKLVMDNFWNGKPMLVRMSDLAGKRVELRILPLRKDAPIYLQKEQKALLDSSKESLLKLNGISILSVITK
jgi:hypothetical protein